jgi:hypothetical protein
LAEEMVLRLIPEYLGRTCYVTACLGDVLVHKDKVNVSKAEDRTRYAKAIHAKCDAIQVQEIEDALLKLVKPPPAEGESEAGDDARPTIDPTELYSDATGILCRSVSTREGGRVDTPICSFTARIVEEIVCDDGVEVTRRLAIEGKLANGEPLLRTEVPIDAFAQGDWVIRSWGTQPVVYAGMGNKDHLRAALQILSGRPPTRTIYLHTGFRQIDQKWCYLHAGGAIGANGPVANVSVELPAELEKYTLPEPSAGAIRKAAVRGSLGLLQGLAPDKVTFPLLAATVSAPLPGNDFSLHVSGLTGQFKTELAALFQQHFGAEMNARSLPGNWSSTGNALENMTFHCKDAIVVIDDFCPTGSTSDMARYQREADRVFRGSGNRAGRQRLRSDGTLRPTKPPRSTIISTGEDCPKGQSLQARLLNIEIGPGDVKAARLTECQADAAAGLYSLTMACFVQSLASRYEGIRATLQAEVERVRADLAAELGSGGHRRTPTLAARLIFGFDLFLRFAEETGAVNAAEVDSLSARCRRALIELADDQAVLQRAADPVDRSLALLRSVLSKGSAHLASASGECPAHLPQVLGWRLCDDSRFGGEQWKPQGDRIGWIDADDLYLDPDAAFAAVQRLGNEQHDPLELTRSTLHRRFRDRGLLVSMDQESGRLTVRIVIDGTRRRVLHFSAKQVLYLVETGPSGPSGPNGQKPQENGPLSRTTSEQTPGNRVTEVGQKPQQNGSGGPDGPLVPLPQTYTAPDSASKWEEGSL